jgi:Flp pilus assembly protein TadG
MRIRQRLRREDGAAAVEFALIVGVLAMLLFGMLQFGLTFFELQNLRASAREGGRLGAIGATPDAIRSRVESASNGAIQTGEASTFPGFVTVNYSDSGQFTEPGSSQNLTGNTTAACHTSGSATTTDAAVRVKLNLAAAPSHLQSLFTLNIPLLPTITMRPTIDAQFRCEGVT